MPIPHPSRPPHTDREDLRCASWPRAASTPPRRDDDDQGTGTVLDVRPKTTSPRRYQVIFHNDDYTTMEFVVLVLRRFFHKSDAEATYIMLTVHKKGRGIAGIYSRDVAETKTAQVMDFAREEGMPLLVTAEPEPE